MYKNREQAGEKLASLLSSYHQKKETIVIGLPRGGVVVAASAARILHLPLDIIFPRKLTAPTNPELAIGAIAGNELILHHELIEDLHISATYLEKELQHQREEAKRREALFRKELPLRRLEGMTILLMDDGIATGATMEVSILFLKKQKVKKIVVAIPVAPKETFLRMQKKVDEMICPLLPEDFSGVSLFYESFEQTSDEEVLSLLKKANLRISP